jgi:O-antigen ligase
MCMKRRFVDMVSRLKSSVPPSPNVTHPIPRSPRVIRRPTTTPGLMTDITWVSLLLLTVVTISRVHQYVGMIGRLRPALVLFALAIVGAFLQRRVHMPNLLRFWPGRVLIALSVWACLSAVFGISLGSSANFILDSFAKTLLYTVMLIIAVQNWRDLSRLVWAVVIGVGILAWISVVVVGISKTRSNATFDANDVGLIMVMGIPLTVVILQTSGKWGKLFSIAVLLLSAVTVAKSQSRGAFIGMLVVGIGILLSLHAVSVFRRLAIVVAAAVALLVAAPEGYWDLIETLRNPTSDYNWDSQNGRKELAKRGIGYMLNYPVFGIGIHNFARAEGTISSKARDHLPGTGLRWASPHNSYAEVGAELGIPGFLMWTSLVFGGMVGMRRLHRRLPSEWRTGEAEQRFLYSLTAGLPVAMAGFAVTSFFVSFAYLDPVYILAAMTTGAYVCVAQRLGPGVLHARRSAIVRRRRQPVLVPRPEPAALP